MDRYVCTICGYVYDPEQGDPDNGVEPGTKWADVPDDWECPVCGASKEECETEKPLKGRGRNKSHHPCLSLNPFFCFASMGADTGCATLYAP